MPDQSTVVQSRRRHGLPELQPESYRWSSLGSSRSPRSVWKPLLQIDAGVLKQCLHGCGAPMVRRDAAAGFPYDLHSYFDGRAAAGPPGGRFIVPYMSANYADALSTMRRPQTLRRARRKPRSART